MRKRRDFRGACGLPFRPEKGGGGRQTTTTEAEDEISGKQRRISRIRETEKKQTHFR